MLPDRGALLGAHRRRGQRWAGVLRIGLEKGLGVRGGSQGAEVGLVE